MAAAFSHTAWPRVSTCGALRPEPGDLYQLRKCLTAHPRFLHRPELHVHLMLMLDESEAHKTWRPLATNGALVVCGEMTDYFTMAHISFDGRLSPAPLIAVTR